MTTSAFLLCISVTTLYCKAMSTLVKTTLRDFHSSCYSKNNTVHKTWPCPDALSTCVFSLNLLNLQQNEWRKQNPLRNAWELHTPLHSRVGFKETVWLFSAPSEKSPHNTTAFLGWNWITGMEEAVHSAHNRGNANWNGDEAIRNAACVANAHLLSYIGYYFWPAPYRPLSKVVHCIGNRVRFGT
jgi:hypothetical protein